MCWHLNKVISKARRGGSCNDLLGGIKNPYFEQRRREGGEGNTGKANAIDVVERAQKDSVDRRYNSHVMRREDNQRAGFSGKSTPYRKRNCLNSKCFRGGKSKPPSSFRSTRSN